MSLKISIHTTMFVKDLTMPIIKLQGSSCLKSNLTQSLHGLKHLTLCNTKTNLLMNYINTNQLAYPEGKEIFFKQKVKSESKTILDEIWLE